jgi:hypothetical protein
MRRPLVTTRNFPPRPNWFVAHLIFSMATIKKVIAKDVAFLKKQMDAFLRRAAMLEKEAKNQPRIKKALDSEIKLMRKTAKNWSKALKRVKNKF